MNKYSLMIRFVNLLIYKPKFYPFKNISCIYEFIFINQNRDILFMVYKSII